ncbi:FadR/GntR family transcriptional regulator [Sciscionella marina]|uniref:FadR/GntR family transcriptional regulator n=1 Tax=Sciscionella marina TaxID=508770 RepID=UPI00035FC1B2|nr:FadR/GntR family transcriptional regulator [Sciscionella marina]
MALDPIDKTTTLTKVTERLRAELDSGRWPIGTRIPGELVLAGELDVSRPLLREAIRGLTNLGMLEARRGSGTYVRSTASPEAILSSLDTAEVREIYEVQLAYDVQAAGLAANRRTGQDLDRLRGLLEARNRAEDDRADVEGFASADAEFHLAIVQAAGNPLLLELYRYFVVRLEASLRTVHADTTVPTCGYESHQTVFDAIRIGDAELARASARAMVECAINALDQSGAARSGGPG